MIRTQRPLSTVFGFLLAAAFIQSSFAEDKDSTKPFEWNVFLTGWDVLGPLPKQSSASGGIDNSYGLDEPGLRPGADFTFEGKTYRWRRWNGGLVDFEEALEIPVDGVRESVAYAWTTFNSPIAQEVTLSLGHDDSIAVWLNGVEIHRDNNAHGPCRLDQLERNVSLQQGANTLLLKIGQLYGDWETFARLLPLRKDVKRLELNCAFASGTALTRMPLLSLNLQDANGQDIATIHASGHRRNPKELFYSLIPPELDQQPATVRISYAAPGWKRFEQTVSWQDLVDAKISIPLQAERPFAATAVDSETGAPIPESHFLPRGTETPSIAGQDGHVVLPGESPLQRRLWVAARGYQAKQILIEWPRPETQIIRLSKGGKILRGRVVSTEGKPLPGANVSLGYFSGFNPHYITDADGRFEAISLPDDLTDIYPMISCPGYVAKDQFGMKISSGMIAEVTWELALGGTVIGRVTAKKDGRPLAGITITSGFDRFGSNQKKPTVKTDAEGKFRLISVPQGEMLVHAFSDDFAPAMTKASVVVETPSEVNFELDEGLPVTGKVTNPDGKSIPEVWLVSDTWNGARMFQREAHTNADGEFTLPHMPATAVLVHVILGGYVSKRDLNVKGGDVINVTLQPVIEHAIKIRLAGRDEPIPDLEIQKGYLWPGNKQINWSNREWETSRDYNKATGTFRIRLSEPANASISYRFRYPGYEETVIEVSALGTLSKPIDLALKKSTRLQGRVVSAETGEPLAGVGVALVSENDKLSSNYVNFMHPADGLKEFTGVSATSGPRGEFELSQPSKPDDYGFVLTRKDDGFVYIRGVDVWMRDGQIELSYPQAATLAGTITVAGKPLANEHVRIEWIPQGVADNNQYQRPFRVGGEVTTDASGNYRYPGLGPGHYWFYRIKGFNSPTGGGISMTIGQDRLVLHPGETVVHDINQPAGHQISGQTVDSKGNPLGECVITASKHGDRADQVDVVRADGSGHFSFEHLPRGDYTLSADHYSLSDGQRCGLGQADFQGKVRASAPSDQAINLRLTAAGGNRFSNEKTIAGLVAPEISGTPLTSQQPFVLSEQWGKIVVLDFWATWCGPCMAAMPQLKAAYEKFRNRDDVIFLTISLDDDKDLLDKVIKEKDLQFPVFYSGKGWEDASARAFGVTGIPATYVIGRDGRFAVGDVRAENLVQVLEDVLNKPVDPAYSSGKTPSRLTLQLVLDGEKAGVPEAEFDLKAIDASGKTIREDKLPVTGLADQLIWLYPPLQGGRILAVARAKGLAPREQTLENPSPQETLAFRFESPRRVKGRASAGDGKTPAPGITVTLHGQSGYSREAETDEQGNFEIPCLPGDYYILVKGTDYVTAKGTEGFTALPDWNERVTVPEDADPDPIFIPVATAITVTGTVVEKDGSRVAGAKVQVLGNRRHVTSDEQGEFTISGVSSIGAPRLYASRDKIGGMVTLSEADRTKPVKIVLGEGMSHRIQSGLVAGQKLTKFSVWDLEGNSIDWSPTADHGRLLCFCQLATPQGRELLLKSQAWARKHEIEVLFYSADWSRSEAQRGLKLLKSNRTVYFVGPGGLDLPLEWNLDPLSTTVLIDANGTVMETSSPGTLPELNP